MRSHSSPKTRNRQRQQSSNRTHHGSKQHLPLFSALFFGYWLSYPQVDDPTAFSFVSMNPIGGDQPETLSKGKNDCRVLSKNNPMSYSNILHAVCLVHSSPRDGSPILADPSPFCLTTSTNSNQQTVQYNTIQIRSCIMHSRSNKVLNVEKLTSSISTLLYRTSYIKLQILNINRKSWPSQDPIGILQYIHRKVSTCWKELSHFSTRSYYFKKV